ncbi:MULTISPECIES: TolC family protein [Novosphingobium]|uniref:TolC family protein n=1 Tax=Novosphingobium TaxID=165696 RepID=UPI000D6DDBF6|nr:MULTISPECIES: TolC family protein [Novosphingobium]
MIRRLPLLALLLGTVAAPLAAQNALPPEAAVIEAIDQQPSVLAADARLEAARAEARTLRGSASSFNFQGTHSRRWAQGLGQNAMAEFDVQITRPVRLPGKGRLDRDAGELGITSAENRAEDARHQAATLLNDLWWDWLGASAEARVDAQSVANYEASLAAIRRRVSLRDMATLDADQTEAALGEARTQAAQSQGRAELARSRLATRFPTLPLPAEAPDAPVPQLPAEALDALAAQVIERSHEIAAANADAERAAVMAERARKDRLADPSLGVRLFSEFGGLERGAGLVISMPFGGTGRRAEADRMASEGQAADAERAAVRIDVQEIAMRDVTRARSAMQTWQMARDALNAQVAALAKTRRGHQLGAIDLADVLQAERLAHAAFRAEAMARAEAHRAINCLLIDSHNLWIAD